MVKTVNTININAIELKKILTTIADAATKNTAYINDIVNAIIHYYLSASGYYPEHAINTMLHYIDTGALIFK